MLCPNGDLEATCPRQVTAYTQKTERADKAGAVTRSETRDDQHPAVTFRNTKDAAQQR